VVVVGERDATDMSSLSLTELARNPARIHETSPGDAARLISELASLSLALSAQLAREPSDNGTVRG
jgi:hypothetical protein